MSVRAAVKPVPEHQAPTMGRIARAWPVGGAALDVAGAPAPIQLRAGARFAEIGGQISCSVYGSLGGKQ